MLIAINNTTQHSSSLQRGSTKAIPSTYKHTSALVFFSGLLLWSCGNWQLNRFSTSYILTACFWAAFSLPLLSTQSYSRSTTSHHIPNCFTSPSTLQTSIQQSHQHFDPHPFNMNLNANYDPEFTLIIITPQTTNTPCFSTQESSNRIPF